MTRHLLAALLATALAVPAAADRAGDFDYYVLALSWTPSWCALEGDARHSPQCDPGQGFGFTLHGLWPQHETGWPSDCRSPHRPPSRAMTAAQTPLFGSGGLAWHQWNKHGTCTGLSPADYYALSRRAYDSITRPDLLRRLDRPVRLPAQVIEDAFLEVNPDLTDAMMTTTCRDDRVQELRVCLTRDLSPRPCAPDIARDCPLDDTLFDPIR